MLCQEVEIYALCFFRVLLFQHLAELPDDQDEYRCVFPKLRKRIGHFQLATHHRHKRKPVEVRQRQHPQVPCHSRIYSSSRSTASWASPLAPTVAVPSKMYGFAIYGCVLSTRPASTALSRSCSASSRLSWLSSNKLPATCAPPMSVQKSARSRRVSIDRASATSSPVRANLIADSSLPRSYTVLLLC